MRFFYSILFLENHSSDNEGMCTVRIGEIQNETSSLAATFIVIIYNVEVNTYWHLE